MRSKLLAGGVILLFASMSTVSAYEADWNNKKLKGEDPNSEFSIGGQLFIGYDFVDRQTNGQLDVPTDRGSSLGQGTGFDIQRVYLVVKGKVKSGPAAGWDYNVTLDGGYHEAEWIDTKCTITNKATGKDSTTDTCAISGQPKNDIGVFVKNAYVTAPLKFMPGKSGVRLGMQDLPTDNGESGVKSTSMWGHRYLADAGKPHLAEVGLSPAVDMGASVFHRTDMYGVHLMLANGDGYHKANAQGLASLNKPQTLSTLAQNSQTAGYGLDLYGNVSIIPTGKDKKNHFSVSLPFRIYNAYGIKKEEYQTWSYDSTLNANTNPDGFNFQTGTAGALKDKWYGYEAVYQNKSDALEFTLGYGSQTLYDRGGEATSFAGVQAVDGVPLGNFNAEAATVGLYGGCGSKTGNARCVASNNKGDVTYWYAHAKMQKVGAFIRVFDGSNNGTGNTVKAPNNGTSQMAKLLVADAATAFTPGGKGFSDGFTVSQYMASLDTKGRFLTTEYGVEYFANAMFRIALGTKYSTYTAKNGETLKTSAAAGLYNNAGTTTVEAQLRDMKNPRVYEYWAGVDAATYKANGTVPADDYNRMFGKEQKDQQTWIRAMVVY